MSLIFPTSLSQALVNQEIDQVRQELLEERLKKRRAREVEDNLVKQARGQLSKWGWIGTPKRAMEKLLFLFACLHLVCKRQTYPL